MFNKLKIACYWFSLIFCTFIIPSQQANLIYKLELQPDEQIPEAQTQLQEAIRTNKIKLAHKIINENNININELLYGRLFTPLTLAIRYNLSDMVQFLLKQGADVECISFTKNTPLTLAATLPRRRKILTLLIEQKAEIDARNHNGKTAIQEALDYGRKENVKELLNRGASLTKADMAQLSLKGRQLATLLLQDPEVTKVGKRLYKLLDEQGMYPDINLFMQKTMIGQE